MTVVTPPANGRPRILCVSTRLPQPLDSGLSIRMRHLLESLSAAGEVHWVGYAFDNETAEFASASLATTEWLKRCASMRVLSFPRWTALEPAPFEHLVRRRPFARRSLYFSTFPGEPLRQLVARMAHRADLVFVTALATADTLVLPPHRTIVDINDLEQNKIARQAQIASGFYRRWALRREAARIGGLESRAPGRVARVAVCSEVDAAHLCGDAGRIWVVPNGTDDELFGRVPPPKIPGRLVFVGTLGYGPNEDAATYFVTEVLPRVTQHSPNVTLSIVGKAPSTKVRSLHDGQRVYVHADVPDVARYVQEAVATVAPLRVAGGTRLKILESLALRTPVVSTTVGAEGLELRNGTDLLIADTAEVFARAVVRLVQSPEFGTSLALHGHERVRRIYRWSRIRDQFTTRVKEWAAALGPADQSPPRRAPSDPRH